MDILIKHAKIVLIVSLTLWFLYLLKWTRPISIFLESANLINATCLFLILSLGISHGALDHLKGDKLLKIFKIKSIMLFYITYTSIGFFVIFLWILFPTFSLAVFLILACYHFGREDSYFVFDEKKKWHDLLFLSKGLLIVAAPLFLHNEETINIFKLLGADIFFLMKFQDNLTNEYHKILMIIALLANIFFFIICSSFTGSKKSIKVFGLDLLPVIFLNQAFTPLVAFTLYFCFIHSFRHSVSLISLLDAENFKKKSQKFFKKALPLTLITAVLFLISVHFLTNYYVLNDAIVQVIFIGLASLTFPHILLEYLLEKNEKKT